MEKMNRFAIAILLTAALAVVLGFSCSGAKAGSTGTSTTGTSTSTSSGTLTSTGTGTATGTSTATGTGTLTGSGTSTSTSTLTGPNYELAPNDETYWTGWSEGTVKGDGDLWVSFRVPSSTYVRCNWAKFDMSTVPAGATVLGATFSVTVYDVRDQAVGVYLKRLKKDPVTTIPSLLVTGYETATQVAPPISMMTTGSYTFVFDEIGIAELQNAIDTGASYFAVLLYAY